MSDQTTRRACGVSKPAADADRAVALLHTSVRVGQQRVHVCIRPATALDWAGLLDSTVRYGAAIAGFAAAALRDGRHQVCLVARAEGIALDDARAARHADCPGSCDQEHE